MKKATEIGEINVAKPVWRVVLDTISSVISQIKGDTVEMAIKGITTICFVGIVAFALVKVATSVSLGGGGIVIMVISIIASAVVLGIVWLHNQ